MDNLEMLVLIVLSGWFSWGGLVVLAAVIRIRGGKLAGSDFFLFVFIYALLVPPAIFSFMLWGIARALAFILEIPAGILAPGWTFVWAGRFSQATIRRMDDNGLTEMRKLLERRWATIHYGSYEKYELVLKEQERNKQARRQAAQLRKILTQAANVNATLQKQGTSLLELVQSGQMSADDMSSFYQVFGHPQAQNGQHLGAQLSDSDFIEILNQNGASGYDFNNTQQHKNGKGNRQPASNGHRTPNMRR